MSPVHFLQALGLAQELFGINSMNIGYKDLNRSELSAIIVELMPGTRTTGHDPFGSYFI